MKDLRMVGIVEQILTKEHIGSASISLEALRLCGY